MIISHNTSTVYTSMAKTALHKKTSSGESVPNKENTSKKASGEIVDISVSAQMTSQLHGLKNALENINRGRDFIKKADGYVLETQNILKKLRALAVKAAKGSHSAPDRLMFQVQVSALIDEVDRIASQGEYNRFNLLQGHFGRTWNRMTSMWFQIGPNMHQRERVYISTMTASGLSLRERDGMFSVSLATRKGSKRSIGILNKAILKVSKQRADLASYLDRFKHSADLVKRSINTIVESGEVPVKKSAAAELLKTIDKLSR
ncbi:MAG: flagellin [bacterium]|nr:flagellin [bacterium]